MLFKDMFGISNASKYNVIAKKYFPVRIGGHANENLVRLIGYIKEGYDGVIMLRPFACGPETAIEPIVERISREHDIPVLNLSIDESTLETHFQTRIESFVDILKMRKAAR
jgi:predicted nucleotide-binding protein (sugar kinase/HSP70/actin superfamily)